MNCVGGSDGVLHHESGERGCATYAPVTCRGDYKGQISNVKNVFKKKTTTKKQQNLFM